MIKTGAQHISSLKDGRAVYLNGRRGDDGDLTQRPTETSAQRS